jgi:glycosyltransferase involved in cell wall biosynthesis
VTVFAAGPADPAIGAEPICPTSTGLDFSKKAREDVSMLAEPFMQEHHAYLGLMLRLPARAFDVVHNNSLHYLPIAMAPTLSAPMLSTLHTPPVPWLESAACTTARAPRPNASYVAVSSATAAQWRPSLGEVAVILNGVDLARWTFSESADRTRAVWFGRIVPEKGPHLALQAAHRAGLALDLAGPIHDRAYFDGEIVPLLDGRRRHVGHLRHDALRRLVGNAGVCLVTPCWDEPYGLVVAEALACGTPVAAFDRGAMREILDDTCGRLAPCGDAAALAAAALDALTLPRTDCRRRADTHCSLDVMVDRYEAAYQRLIAQRRSTSGVPVELSAWAAA